MIFIKNMKKFLESSSNIDIEKFIKKNIHMSGMSPKYTIHDNGEVSIVGNVQINPDAASRSLPSGSGKLDSIPFKFRSVTGSFDCSGNNFESFEFLPDDCMSYILLDNPGFKGILKKAYTLSYVNDAHYTIIPNTAMSGKLFTTFVQNCIDSGIWYEGKTNWDLIGEVYIDTKLKEYNKNKSFIDNISIDSNDVEILQDYLGTKKTQPSDLLNLILESIRSEDEKSKPFLNMEVIFNIWSDNKSESEKVFEKWGILDSISKLMKKIDFFRSEYNSRKSDNFSKPRELRSTKNLVISKIKRKQSDIEFEENFDTFVFIGREKFVKLDNGSYKKSLEIENLYKIDKYDFEDNSSISMMKLRSRTQGGDLYFIHIPKDALPEKSYTESEIPDYLVDLIDDKKTKF